MCWPVLYPQMVGEPMVPGEVMENWSVTQSPIAKSEKKWPIETWKIVWKDHQIFTIGGNARGYGGTSLLGSQNHGCEIISDSTNIGWTRANRVCTRIRSAGRRRCSWCLDNVGIVIRWRSSTAKWNWKKKSKFIKIQNLYLTQSCIFQITQPSYHSWISKWTRAYVLK